MSIFQICDLVAEKLIMFADLPVAVIALRHTIKKDRRGNQKDKK